MKTTRIDPPDVEFIDMYFDKKMSTSVIGAEYGVGRSTVGRWINDAGFRLRERNATKRWLWEPTVEALEIINGGLLGDASIKWSQNTRTRRTGICSTAAFAFSQVDKRRQWIDETAVALLNDGLPCGVYRRWGKPSEIRGKPVRGAWQNILCSRSTASIGELRRSWYPVPAEIKRVPLNLKLTPRMVAHWFMGDGTGGADELTFYTNSFTESEVEFLCGRLLIDLGVEAWPSRLVKADRPPCWLVNVGRLKEQVKLRDAILPFMSACCLYKLSRVHEPTRRRSLTNEEAKTIREAAIDGSTETELQERFGKGAVHSVLRGGAYLEPDCWPERLRTDAKSTEALIKKYREAREAALKDAGRSKKFDLVGQINGKLTVIASDDARRVGHNRRSRRYWICECKCGNRTSVSTGAFNSGSVASCGKCPRDRGITTEQAAKIRKRVLDGAAFRHAAAVEGVTQGIVRDLMRNAIHKIPEAWPGGVPITEEILMEAGF